MKFNILTLFPEIFPGPLNHSLTGKALKNKLFKINTINIRDFSLNFKIKNINVYNVLASIAVLRVV